MPLYEILVISRREATMEPLKRLMTRVAQAIMQERSVEGGSDASSPTNNGGGIIRRIEYLGDRSLPQRMKHQEGYAYEGSYWLMNFHSNPRMLEDLQLRLRRDFRDIIRFTVTKRGEKLKDIVDG